MNKVTLHKGFQICPPYIDFAPELTKWQYLFIPVVLPCLFANIQLFPGFITFQPLRQKGFFIGFENGLFNLLDVGFQLCESMLTDCG